MSRDRYEDVSAVEREGLSDNQKQTLKSLLAGGHIGADKRVMLWRLLPLLPEVKPSAVQYQREQAKTRRYAPALAGLWKRGLVEKVTVLINQPGGYAWWLTEAGAEVAAKLR